MVADVDADDADSDEDSLVMIGGFLSGFPPPCLLSLSNTKRPPVLCSPDAESFDSFASDDTLLSPREASFASPSGFRSRRFRGGCMDPIEWVRTIPFWIMVPVDLLRTRRPSSILLGKSVGVRSHFSDFLMTPELALSRTSQQCRHFVGFSRPDLGC